MTSPWHGGRITERATCVLAPNPGPMTLDGTNTWVLAEPGANAVVVIDPGPDDPAHLSALLAEVGDREVATVLLTHRHPDHVAGAATFAAMASAPVRSVDPTFRYRGGGGLAEGERLSIAGLDLRVMATPGHTDDCVCFWLPADRAVLTGDTVLGRGSTVVAHPDGRLADYLESLHRLADLAGDRVDTVYPGHGPVLPDALAAIEWYLEHRRQRLEQVRAAVANGLRTPREVVEAVYSDVDPSLWTAAEWSVAAQLEYLEVIQ
ncbi:MAG: MBL fold metallo-hydrolase [Sporichthyaceae bacterium]